MNRLWLCFVLFVFLAGCAGQGKPTQVPSSTIASPSLPPTTLTPTRTLAPTSTYSPMATGTATVSATNTFLTTPFSTSAPTIATPIIPSVYDLPSWMSNPNTPIMASLIANDYTRARQLLIVNASTGEQYDMPIPPKAGGFFWLDNSHFGFITSDSKTIFLIDTSNGQVSTIMTDEQATRFVSVENEYYLAALLVVQGENSNKDFYFNWAYDRYASPYSKNNSFLASMDTGQTEFQISVRNMQNNLIEWRSKPDDGIWDMEYAWSPINDNLLAIVGGRPEPINMFITEDMTLSLLDLRENEVVRTFYGNFGLIEWSPDGRQILYLDPCFIYRNCSFAFQNAPCLLNLESGESKCLTSIPYAHIPDQYSLMITGVYHWMSDGLSIAYTYIYESIDPTWQILGDLCIYNLNDGTIGCPTEGLEALTERSITSYDFSPDEKYVHFCLSAGTMLNDHSDVASDGIISIDGTGFTSWTSHIIEDGPISCSGENIWRPLP